MVIPITTCFGRKPKPSKKSEVLETERQAEVMHARRRLSEVVLQLIFWTQGATI